jgi:hypothetical protein
MKVPEMSKIALLLGVVFLLVAACDDDECSDASKSKNWCEDNVVMLCVGTGVGGIFGKGHNKKVEEEDCSESNKVCVENDRGAVCVDPNE